MYRRARWPGGTYFFTLITENREPFLCEPAAREILRKAIVACQTARPFTTDAMVLLPDHLHAIWTLPEGDTDYSGRWASIKAGFTRAWINRSGREQGRSASRVRHRRRGVWQRRFWEHLIRDSDDLSAHLDYVHYNPVKHGYVACPHLWPHSTFHRWAREGFYEHAWKCVCNGGMVTPPIFSGLDEVGME